MGASGIPFTLANFFAIPILIGLGVDSGVQIMHRFRSSGTALGSTAIGVILTSCSTIASFGMLCMAAHRGIRGLGLIMTLGALTIMLAAILVLPAIISLAPASLTTVKPYKKTG